MNLLRTLRYFILLGLLFLYVQPLEAGLKQIEIRILPESIVYDDTYMLGEIAEIDGFDVELIQKLAKTSIGKSPVPGRSVNISKSRILSKLRQNFKKQTFIVEVPYRSMVSRASIKVSSEQLKRVILEEVKKAYTQYKDTKITILSKVQDIYLPKGKISYEVSKIGKSDVIGGTSSWALQLKLDQKKSKKILVRVTAEVIENVLVVKKKIKKGSNITRDDLMRIRKDISRERKSAIFNEDLVIGKQARRDLSAKETIKPNLVRLPIILQKGEAVKLVYENKLMRLTNLAKAMKSGKKGDMIPVRTIKGNKTVYAVIVDARHVEVAL